MDIIDQLTKHKNNIKTPKESKNEKVTILSHGVNVPKPTEFRDFKKELRNKLIKQQIGEYLNFEIKDNISVTTLIGCPLQIWLRHFKIIKYDNLDINKIFTPLHLYGQVGTYLHNKVYDMISIDKDISEIKLVDKQHKIVGKLDLLYNNTIIDIKTSTKVNDHSGQLALYYHLCNINNIPVNGAKIWYVLLDKEEDYDLHKLNEIIPILLERCDDLWNSINNKTPPKYVDLSECQYCLIENYCKKNFVSNK